MRLPGQQPAAPLRGWVWVGSCESSSPHFLFLLSLGSNPPEPLLTALTPASGYNPVTVLLRVLLHPGFFGGGAGGAFPGRCCSALLWPPQGQALEPQLLWTACLPPAPWTGSAWTADLAHEYGGKKVGDPQRRQEQASLDTSTQGLWSLRQGPQDPWEQGVETGGPGENFNIPCLGEEGQVQG